MKLSRDRPRRPTAQPISFRNYYSEDQIEIIEWLLSVTLIVTGIHMLLWPEAVAISHMRALTSYAPGWAVAGVGFLIGMMRVSCIINRMSRESIRNRAFLSAISVVIWGEMVIAFAFRWWGQVPPPGFEMLTIMQLVGEIWLVFRIKRQAAQLRADKVIL